MSKQTGWSCSDFRNVCANVSTKCLLLRQTDSHVRKKFSNYHFRNSPRYPEGKKDTSVQCFQTASFLRYADSFIENYKRPLSIYRSQSHRVRFVFNFYIFCSSAEKVSCYVINFKIYSLLSAPRLGCSRSFLHVLYIHSVRLQRFR